MQKKVCSLLIKCDVVELEKFAAVRHGIWGKNCPWKTVVPDSDKLCWFVTLQPVFAILLTFWQLLLRVLLFLKRFLLTA